MNPLSTQNIESELSYAYLHAVASKAGMSVREATRHEDNAGIDATLTAWGPFKDGGYLQEVDFKIQLKATIKTPGIKDSHLSYFLSGVKRYNDLRATDIATPRFLVVLFLPENADNWLTHTEDALAIKTCAYWVSLRDAPQTDNESGQTIYLPKKQSFNPENVMKLASDLSKMQTHIYQGVGS
jgi:Domain of unknown function (DUF4365)